MIECHDFKHLTTERTCTLYDRQAGLIFKKYFKTLIYAHALISYSQVSVVTEVPGQSNEMKLALIEIQTHISFVYFSNTNHESRLGGINLTVLSF